MFRLVVAGIMIAMGIFGIYEGIIRPYLEVRGLKRRPLTKRQGRAFHTTFAAIAILGGLLVLYGPLQ